MTEHESVRWLTCPSCTAPVREGETMCGRCGQQVERSPGAGGLRAAGPTCPRCSRAVRPGQTYVTASGEATDAACPHCGTALDPAPPAATGPSHYEEKAERCLPTDLERLARAEAVDGWAMLDTTIDPRRPGMILVHFRRPARGVVREQAQPRPEQRQPHPAQTRPASTARPVKPRRVKRRRRRQAPVQGTTHRAPGAAEAQPVPATQADPSAHPPTPAPRWTTAGTIAWACSPRTPHRMAATFAGPVVPEWHDLDVRNGVWWIAPRVAFNLLALTIASVAYVSAFGAVVSARIGVAMVQLGALITAAVLGLCYRSVFRTVQPPRAALRTR